MSKDRAVNAARSRASQWFPDLQALKFVRWRLYAIHVRHSVRTRKIGEKLPPHFRITEDMNSIPWDGYTPLFHAYRFGPEPTDVMLTPDPRMLPILGDFSSALIHRYVREVVRGNPKQVAQKYKNLHTVE